MGTSLIPGLPLLYGFRKAGPGVVKSKNAGIKNGLYAVMSSGFNRQIEIFSIKAKRIKQQEM
jgi:hypothetical protein